MIAGDIVFLAASLLGPSDQFVIHEAPPIVGFVESLVGGTPPTNVVVVWSNGSRVQYDAVNSGATSVLFGGASFSSGPLVVGAVVQPKSGSGIPNPGGRLKGPVVQQWILVDPNDAAVRQVVVVDTPLGFLVMDVTDATVLPSA